MPIIPARTTAGSRNADSSVSAFMTSLARCATRPMWMSYVPSKASRVRSMAVDRALQPVEQPGPGSPDIRRRVHLGSGQRGKCMTMRREDASDRPDAPADLDDADGRMSSRPPAQRCIIEPVDVTLDVLGQSVVAHDHLVDQAGQEVARVEDPERGVTIDPLGITVDGLDMAGGGPSPRGHAPRACRSLAGPGAHLQPPGHRHHRLRARGPRA